MQNLTQKQREHLCFLAGVAPESLPEGAGSQEIVSRFQERFAAEQKLLETETIETAERLAEISANPVRRPLKLLRIECLCQTCGKTFINCTPTPNFCIWCGAKMQSHGSHDRSPGKN